jgi:rfaE bifunctional protein nucleotidyltransferase chain/domain
VSQFSNLQQKIQTVEELLPQIAEWRKEGEIVFSNGCFDILHLGHLDYLSQAADLGHKLILGLNSDASVSRLKGPSRPINDQKARASMLAALSFVDAVVFFEEDTPYELIKAVQPDILVKGADYAIEEIVGHDIVLARGGRVIPIDLLEGYSTTAILEKLNNG